MPVIVEAAIAPSRLQLFLDLLPIGLSLMLLTVLGYYWCLPFIALATGWIWFHQQRSEQDFQYLRFDGERLLLWQNENDCQTYQWAGEGWRTPLFLRWNLKDEDGLKLTLYLWKDSVSDASWRALNMALRVNSTLVKAP